MSSFFTRTATTLALAATGLSATSAAQAATVTLDGWAFGQAHSVRASGYVGLAGGFTGSLVGAGAGFDATPFLTYCIEIEEQFAFGANALGAYTLVEGRDYFARRRGNAAIADKLGALMAQVSATPALVDSDSESTSLQLAVWNLIYDTDFNVSARSAFRDTSAFAGHANTLLATLDLPQSAMPMRVWALESAGSQDFLLVLPASGPNPVPVPATVALALLGLGAIAGTRRRAAVA
ncbi:MAG: hypothetical protein ACOVOT_13690 [Rubrivivax sp.]|jgi:MYXO-CTERM domain-containing protein|nr:hypothetical protein [Rubrivivax sp.]